MVKSKGMGFAPMEKSSTMSLEGKHANGLKGGKVGQKMKILVTGQKSSHYQNSDGSHSIGFKIDDVKMHQDDKDYSGPNKKAANNGEGEGAVA